MPIFPDPRFGIVTLCGLGLFLYGIGSISTVLKKIAGPALKKVINKFTSNRILGFLVGTGFTTIIQSSSATSTLAISLVRAGVMTMIQGAAIIVGANIGTTITAFIVSLPIAEYLAITLFIGAFILLLVSRNKYKNWGELLFALGSIFLGLWIMSMTLKTLPDAIPGFNDIFVFLAKYPWLGLLVGTIITTCLQSSSAVIGIVQSIYAAALAASLAPGSSIAAIPLFGLLPLLFGANVGTTSTALLATIGGSKESKRVAYFHIFFNLAGALLFMGIIHIPPIKEWLSEPENFIGITGKDGQGAKVLLALAHLIFNTVMSLIFLPLLTPICKLLEKIAPGSSRQTPSIVINELDSNIMKQFPSEGLSLAKTQVLAMFNYSKVMFDTIDMYIANKNSEDSEFVHEIEANIDRIDRQMNDYLLVADKGSLSYKEMKDFTRILRGTKDIERIGDYGENLITFFENANEKKDFFADRTLEIINEAHKAAIKIIEDTIYVFENEDKEKAIKIIQFRRDAHSKIEKNIEELLNNLTNNDKNKAKYSNLVIFDIMSCYQRIYAHCSNIAKLFGTDKEYVYSTQEEERFAAMRNRY